MNFPQWQLLVLACFCSSVVSADDAPYGIATFECIGLYWQVPDRYGDQVCQVSFRPEGKNKWRSGFPLWFDARNNEYRGSLVHLEPGTTYEIKLSLAGASAGQTLKCTTWSETFPIGKTVELPSNSSETLLISESGTPDGYLLYTHSGTEPSKIDVANRHDHCVVVEGSYVILRGLDLQGAGVHAVVLKDGVHDVVIEQCSFSDWGSIAEDKWGKNYNSAIYSQASDLKRIVIQRNTFGPPRSDANSWREYRPAPGKREPNHPEGPQAVCFWDSEGNHVIRYNCVFGAPGRQYNDIFGAGRNFSLRGFPNQDSDIYGNALRDCWDDAIESEGANCNVRIWNNYIDDCFVAIACASTSVGPLYVWRNVCRQMRIAPNDWGGGFLKTSDRTAGGRIYVFHNTVLNPTVQTPTGKTTAGARVGLGWGGPMVNVVSRNNVFHVKWLALRDKANDPQNDFDYDLFRGEVPDSRHEQHGIRGEPVFSDAFAVDGDSLNIALKPGTPGHDAGLWLPNFNDGFHGEAPDMGAHEAGDEVMQFGVSAAPEP